MHMSSPAWSKRETRQTICFRWTQSSDRSRANHGKCDPSLLRRLVGPDWTPLRLGYVQFATAGISSSKLVLVEVLDDTVPSGSKQRTTAPSPPNASVSSSSLTPGPPLPSSLRSARSASDAHL